MDRIVSSEITPEDAYWNRRRFLRGAGALAATSLVLAGCAKPNGDDPSRGSAASGSGDGTGAGPSAGSEASASLSNPASGDPSGAGATAKSYGTADELGDKVTPEDTVTNFNNFYEFTTDKEQVAPMAKGFKTDPWTVQVGGMVGKPQTFDPDSLKKLFGEEERVYRLRCVEGWSIVVPWLGFPLAKLLQAVEPSSAAKFVRFESVFAPDQLPGQKDPTYNWPYIEGLRVDEAMNELALLVTGVYGKPLPPQNGAPVRLAVPWKYGFKSVKSIVKIDLVDKMPSTLWMDAAPNEYGFYANVNPEVSHPRWSQSTERRLGEFSRRKTLAFNGYSDKVAVLYAGMDLQANF